MTKMNKNKLMAKLKNKLKTFFVSFKRSLTDFSYYRDIKEAKFSFSLKYLYSLLFIISLFAGVQISASLIYSLPQIPGFVEKIKTSAQGAFPSELKIEVKGGKLSTNAKEPYTIDISGISNEEHFLIIDTKAKAEDIKNLNTLALATESSVVIKADGGYRFFSLDKYKDVKIDKAVYDATLSKVLPFLDKLPLIVKILAALSILAFPFVGAALSLAGRAIYLVFASILLFVIAKILKKGLSFIKIFQFSLHAVTLPILVTLLLTTFRIRLGILELVIFLIFFIAILVKFDQTKIKKLAD